MTADECYNEAERLLSGREPTLEMQALRAEIATAYMKLGNAKRARAVASKKAT